MRKSLILFIFGLISFQSISQNIQIGQNAQQVKGLVEWSTSKNQKDNALGQTNSHWTWNTKYNDGELLEVIQCFQNQYLIDFQIKTDYCERFIMNDGILRYTVKEFQKLSLEEVKQYYVSNDYAKYAIDDLYFSDDFQFYYKFFHSKSNLASVELHKVEFEKLARETLSKLNIKKAVVDRERLIDKRHGDSLRDNTPPVKRTVLNKATPQYNCNEEGRVIVEVLIDREGKAKKAIPGIVGTTTQSKCLLEAAKIAALQTRWESNADASEEQTVKISYWFKF